MTVKLEKLSIKQLYKLVANLTHERDELQRKLEKAESAIATGFESIDNSLHVLRVETERSNQLAVENATLKTTLEYVISPDNQPEYHDQGMGCGVEDRGLQRDAYGACAYGWESAMDRMYSEVIPDSLPETPATNAAIVEIEARGVEACASHLLSNDDISCECEYPMMMKFAEKLRKESGR